MKYKLYGFLDYFQEVKRSDIILVGRLVDMLTKAKRHLGGTFSFSTR